MLFSRVRVSKGPFLEVSTLSNTRKVGDTEIGKTLVGKKINKIWILNLLFVSMIPTYFHFSWVLIVCFHDFNGEVCSSHGNTIFLTSSCYFNFWVFKLFIKGRLRHLVKLKLVNEHDSLGEYLSFSFCLRTSKRSSVGEIDECEKCTILSTQSIRFRCKFSYMYVSFI